MIPVSLRSAARNNVFGTTKTRLTDATDTDSNSLTVSGPKFTDSNNNSYRKITAMKHMTVPPARPIDKATARAPDVVYLSAKTSRRIAHNSPTSTNTVNTWFICSLPYNNSIFERLLLRFGYVKPNTDLLLYSPNVMFSPQLWWMMVHNGPRVEVFSHELLIISFLFPLLDRRREKFLSRCLDTTDFCCLHLINR